MSRVTLSTIAAETGLSKYAVSRALSGKSGVSERTRTRVSEVAARLGYQKPAYADPKPFDVVVDETDAINSELHMQIQAGARREAQGLGLNLRFHGLNPDTSLETLAKGSAGMVVVGRHVKNDLDKAYATGTPIVRVGWIDPLEQVDQIAATDHEAGSAVGKYLLDLGHREIVYVHGEPRYRGRWERLYGLREVMEATPGTTLHNLTWENGSDFSREFRAFRATGKTPTAFCCAHDGLAVTVISELLSLGVRIPDDVSVIGFGDYSAAQQILPHLTTIKVPGTNIGVMAVRLLHSRASVQDFPTFPIRMLIPSFIVERNSVGPVRELRTAIRARTGADAATETVR